MVSLINSYDVRIDYYFQPNEVYKHDDELKLIAFNSLGSLLALSTKSNGIFILDFIAKSLVFEINFFKIDGQTNSKQKYVLNGITWSEDSKLLIVNYKKIGLDSISREELQQTCSYGVKSFLLNFKYINKPYYSVLNLSHLENIPHKIVSVSYHDAEKIFIMSGSKPLISDSNFLIDLFGNYLNEKNYTFLVRDITLKNVKNINDKTLLLIVKELYLILILENCQFNKPLDMSSLNADQINFVQEIKSKTNMYSIVNLCGLNVQADILQIEIDQSKTLLIINSSDKYLRLFKIEKDFIMMFKDFCDPVNKKRWMNCYFYSVKTWKRNRFKYQEQIQELVTSETCNNSIKFENQIAELLNPCAEKIGEETNPEDLIQDMIITALCDSSSLEFVILDLNSGKIVKKMDPFKYSCNDFVVHSANHFTIALISSKKIYKIIGYYVNQWETFAPHFSYIENNIEYMPSEEFFDNFHKNIEDLEKKKLNSYSKGLIKSMFKPVNRANMFFRYDINSQDEQSIRSKEQLSAVMLQIKSNSSYS